VRLRDLARDVVEEGLCDRSDRLDRVAAFLR